jgi:hypothetical protein
LSVDNSGKTLYYFTIAESPLNEKWFGPELMTVMQVTKDGGKTWTNVV